MADRYPAEVIVTVAQILQRQKIGSAFSRMAGRLRPEVVVTAVQNAAEVVPFRIFSDVARANRLEADLLQDKILPRQKVIRLYSDVRQEPPEVLHN